MPEESRTKRHALAGAVIFLLGLSIVFSSIPLFRRAVVQDVGPGMFPLVIGLLLAFLGLYEGMASLPRRTPEAPSRKSLLPKDVHRHASEFALVGILIFYFGSLHILGFLISTFGFLLATTRVFGARRWWESLLFSAIVSIGIYWLFVKQLNLTLPEGVLGL